MAGSSPLTAAGFGMVLPVSTLGRTVSNTGISEYLFLEWVGMHLPHQKVEGLVLSVLISHQLQCTWLTNNLIQLEYAPVFAPEWPNWLRPNWVRQRNKRQQHNRFIIKTVNQWGFPEWARGRELYGA